MVSYQKRSIWLFERHEEVVHFLPAPLISIIFAPTQVSWYPPVDLVPSAPFARATSNSQRANCRVCWEEMCRLFWTTAKAAIGMLPCHYRINRSGGTRLEAIESKTDKSAYFCLLPGSKPTCKMLNACRVQYINHDWLASWLVYRAGNPCTRLRMRNCMCAFFCRTGASPTGT